MGPSSVAGHQSFGEYWAFCGGSDVVFGFSQTTVFTVSASSILVIPAMLDLQASKELFPLIPPVLESKTW
jgi:hypothetical protein